jgi:hypothetical protein
MDVLTGHKAGLLVVLLTAAGLVTGCAPAAEPASGTSTTTSAAQSAMAHLHALGVDPGDGALYAASHHGLFRIQPGSPPQLIGGAQDTMGFVVAGPRHFFGSGHPAPGESKPPNLGLIESTDAGATWQSVSLSGQVDFHSMDIAKGQIFGYDSQTSQVMVSLDGKTWERRARLSLADLAVAPDDPQFLLATTSRGLAHSADGGRTFMVIPKTPVFQLIDWPTPELIVAVQPTGAVASSADHGGTWTTLGTVSGTPQALTVHDTSVYVATDKGIYASADGGKTFTLRQSL